MIKKYKLSKNGYTFPQTWPQTQHLHIYLNGFEFRLFNFSNGFSDVIYSFSPKHTHFTYVPS